MVCSTNSRANKYHFCYISTKSSDKCTNCIDHSTVAKLYSESINGENAHLSASDIIPLKYNNISNNECFAQSALVCDPSVKSSLLYTTFENNTSRNDEVISFWHNRENDMNSCNVILNTASIGILKISGSLIISNSCLEENDNKPMFWFVGSSSCTINNCTIDNIKKYSKYGTVVVDSDKTPAMSFINKLNGLHYTECIYSRKDIKIKLVCKTFNMEKNRWSMMRRKENYISLLL